MRGKGIGLFEFDICKHIYSFSLFVSSKTQYISKVVYLGRRNSKNPQMSNDLYFPNLGYTGSYT